MADFLRRRGVERLDLLIHCAGVGSYGPAEAQTAAARGGRRPPPPHAFVSLWGEGCRCCPSP